jgi:DNA-binding transcriptional ArsR family regulator
MAVSAAGKIIELSIRRRRQLRKPLLQPMQGQVRVAIIVFRHEKLQAAAAQIRLDRGPVAFEILSQVVLSIRLRFVAKALAQFESISRAARSLGMPISTVSRRLSVLESKLGVSLGVHYCRE